MGRIFNRPARDVSHLPPPPAGEVRDPRGATQAVRFIGDDQPMIPQWDAQSAITNGYNASWAVNRCVQIIANDVSRLPFRAGADPDKPSDHNPKARLATMLGPPPGGPAPKMTARRWWWFMIAQRLVTGRMGAEIECDQGTDRPAYLWPLTMAMLQPVPTDGGKEFFKGFKYGRADKPKHFGANEVFYDWVPSLDDYREPSSPLQSARLDVSVSVMLGRYSYSFIKNGAVPATIMVVREFGTLADKYKFEGQLNSKFGGTANAGKTMVAEAVPAEDGTVDLSSAIHVEQLGLSAKDARMIEQEQESLKNIVAAMGVSWSRFTSSGETFNNMDHADEVYTHDTFLPLVHDLEDAINIQVAPRCGSEVGWFDLSGVRNLQAKPEPLTAKVGAPSMVQAQLMWINEARAEYGLPPVPDGDRMMTAEEIQALRGSSNPADTLRSMSIIEAREAPAPLELPAPVDIGAAVDEAVTRAMAALAPPPPEPPAPTPIDHAAQRRARRQEQRAAKAALAAKTLDKLEADAAKQFADLFDAQARSVISNLDSKRGHKALEVRAEPAVADLFNPDYWLDRTLTVEQRIVQTVSTAVELGMIKDFGVNFDLPVESVLEFVQARANALKEVTDLTYQSIKDALAEGLAEGESVPDLSKRIRDMFDAWSDLGADDSTGDLTRCRMIARTETISAYGAATQDAGMVLADQGVVGGKEWISTGGPRTRPEHAAADGQIVAIDEAFEVGGASMLYPGDPNGPPDQTVNCRCFPADTLVETDGVELAYKRWYDGDLVEITTAAGHVLAGTPNHPVLTGRGWQPLHSLEEGDSIVSGSVRDDGRRGPDVVNVPTPIGQVSDALAFVAAELGGTQRVLSSSVDFHGDGQNGTVDVVAAGGQLGDGLQSASSEHPIEDVFPVRLEGEVGIANKQANLGIGHRVDAELLSGTATATLDPSRSESLLNQTATDAVVLGDGLLAHPGSVEGSYFVGLDRRLGEPGSDGLSGSVTQRAHETALLEFAAQASDADVVGAASGEHVGPFDVVLDRVLKLSVRRFSGHVYNLKTGNGTYIANGIVVHNCAMANLTVEEYADAIGETARTAARTWDLRRAQAALELASSAEFRAVANLMEAA